jgi:hypothetical protein
MTSNAASLETLLAELHEKSSVLQGWDATLSLSESAINTFIQHQWAALTKDGKLTGAVTWCTGIQDVQNQPHASVTQVNFSLAAPRIELQSGQTNVIVRQALHGVQIKTGTAKVNSALNPADCRFPANDPNVSWCSPVNAVTSNDSIVQATLPVSIVKGLVSANTHSVVLEFAAASFAAQGLTGTSIDHAAFADQLPHWFASSNFRPIIASVDFSDHANLAALQPTSFKLNVPQSAGGNSSLQLLIATQGNQPAATSIDVTEPVPVDTGSDYSLLISSKVLIPNVLVDGYNRGKGLVKLVSIAPDTADGAWYAQTRNPMQYQGTVSFGGAFPDIERSASLGMNFLGSVADGPSISTYIAPGANIELQLRVSANYPLKLSGEGVDQQIQLSAGPATVSATSLAENVVKPQLESFLNNDIKNDMTAVSLTPVSNFALKNLQFPGHIPKMTHVQMPGDLLIVGTFEQSSP